MQGLNDVANRMLRTTIPAESSLWYDPVRILRAIRFSRSHQLNFDSELEYAMENHEIQVRAGLRLWGSATEIDGAAGNN
jgi:tRNA nucleotidyltransferase/poly(A) polymerase